MRGFCPKVFFVLHPMRTEDDYVEGRGDEYRRAREKECWRGGWTIIVRADLKEQGISGEEVYDWA